MMWIWYEVTDLDLSVASTLQHENSIMISSIKLYPQKYYIFSDDTSDAWILHLKFHT